MTQVCPATCVLGPGKTGLTIGLRVLNLDGTEYSAFSTTGVAETSTAGTYRKAGGVVAPLAGGYIVWGEAATDYAEATVESASVNVTRVLDTLLTEGAAGRLAGSLSTFGNVAAPAFTAASVNQTGDSFARLGAPTGASISADVADVEGKVDDLETRLTAARAGYLDNINNAALQTTVAQTGDAYAATQTILARLGAWTGAARNTILGALQALFRSDADATVPSDINADLGSGAGTADNTTDSLEALDASAQAIISTQTTHTIALTALPGDVDTQLSGTHGAGAWGGAGAWPIVFIYTLTSDTSPFEAIDDALIEVYSDLAMTTLVDQGVTDEYGKVRFELPAGTYHLKRTKNGYTFTNPDSETVS